MARNGTALLALGLILTRDVTREIGHGTRDTVKKIGNELND